jgi:adenylate kinase
MNIIILGPQGSGKGTQAELLSQKLSHEHIDIGGSLRRLAKMNSPIGKKIQNLINVQKALIPDEILNEILKIKINSLPKNMGIAFDGVPRTLEQAKYLENILLESGRKIDRVFFVNISEEETMNRISKRWNCEDCKSILIMGKDVKSEKDKCPKCGGNIFQREDDTEEGVRKRLEIFKKETMPVVDYFKEKGLLNEVNGQREVEKVFGDILDNLKSLE